MYDIVFKFIKYLFKFTYRYILAGAYHHNKIYEIVIYSVGVLYSIVVYHT